jgi:hypothetical protein
MENRAQPWPAAILLIAVLAWIILPTGSAVAEETFLTVHVKAKGSKFIGSSMGGARVLVTDAQTGEVLAKGRTKGGTGDTGLIMSGDEGGKGPISRGAAEFKTSIDIERPRKITVTASGPVAQPQATTTASSTQWVVPGGDVTGGNAWMLELPGMVVDATAPAILEVMQGVPQTVDFEANVRMACGCPLVPGGIWDPEGMRIRVVLFRDGKQQRSFGLRYAGRPSFFRGSAKIEEPGLYEALIYAFDPSDGNTGLDRMTFLLRE